MSGIQRLHEAPRREAQAPAVDRKTDPPSARTRSPAAAGVGLAVLLLLGGGLGFGIWRHEQAQSAVATTARQMHDLVPQVQVAVIEDGPAISDVTLPATTTAFEAANIFARTSGYIARRIVDIGDHVKAGDLLAEIVAPELDHQIAQARATLQQNQAALQQTQASRDLADATNGRDSRLVKQGWLTLQQGDNDRLTLAAQQAAVNVAQSNIAAQEAQIRILTQEKSYQRVVAPFDGVITQRNVDNGSLVQSGSTFMFTLMRSNVIRVQLFVPQDAAFGVTPGVTASIHVPEIPGRVFDGTVTRTASAVQPGSRTLLTEVDIANPDGALSPGIYCTVDLHVPRKSPAVIVPANAVIFNADGTSVVAVENGVAHMRKVAIARDFGTSVEVSNGIKAGDQVVLNPAVNLAEGDKVKPQMHAT